MVVYEERTTDNTRSFNAPDRSHANRTLDSEQQECHREIPSRNHILPNSPLAPAHTSITQRGKLTLLTTVIMMLAAQYAMIGKAIHINIISSP